VGNKVSYDGHPVTGGITVKELRSALEKPGSVITLQTEKGRASFTVIGRDASGKGWLTCNDPAVFRRNKTDASFVFALTPRDSFLGYLYISR
jgi:hypothetical protein